MKNGREKRRRIHLLIVMILFPSVFCNCSHRKDMTPSFNTEDVSIYYHADDGIYDRTNSVKDLWVDGQVQKNDSEENEKIIITLQDAGYTDTGVMSFLVAAFNRDNDIYQIKMERFQGDVDVKQERLKMELVAGKGPDIMTFSAIPDAPLLLENGCFMELSELMRKSNMKDDLYFPAYKALKVGEKVYAISPDVDVLGKAIRKDLVENEEIPDIDGLLKKLLDYQQNAIFENAYQDGAGMLQYFFLAGTENLFGMIDWEKKECDFSGELFSQMLDVIKKYAQNATKGYEPIVRTKLMYTSLYPGEEILMNEGWVTMDYYFDDGNYPLYNWSMNTMLINSNTHNLEGAWAFLSYTMTKTGQSIVGNPVSIEAYDIKYKELLEKQGEITEPISYYPLTEQSIAEMKHIFASGRYSPIKTMQIINMITEETEAYFQDTKPKETVIDAIQNRVQLYLEETN